MNNLFLGLRSNLSDAKVYKKKKKKKKTIEKKTTKKAYRQRLERGAREYYEKWLAPEIVVKRILDIAFG